MGGATAEALAALATVAGSQAVRPATAADAVDSVRPGLVVEPDSGEAVAASLQWAARSGHSVVVRGGGTKLDWGRSARSVDVVLSTRRLAQVLAHAHGDLTATVEAGLPLEALNRELSRRGQWLPLDSAFADATIGGILATNDSGPLRHRYGTPRDLLIGLQFATTDGRLVKAGGQVVKNVAGYDLSRLLTGSWGCFAVVVGATFKLTPLPKAFHTVRFALPGPAAALGAATALSASQLEPAALEIRHETARAGREATTQLVARFASTPGVAEAQALEGERLLQGSGLDSARHFTGADEAALWRSHAASLWANGGAVLSVAWLPARLDAVLALVTDLGSGMPLELVGRVAGTGLLGLDGDTRAVIDTIGRLGRQPDVFTRVALLRGDPDVKSTTLARAGSESLSGLVRNLKQAFDPAGILGAGRGPF